MDRVNVFVMCGKTTRNPNVEVNCVDFLRRSGYRFKSTADIREAGDPAYEWIRKWLHEVHGPKMPAHHAVFIEVREARPLQSPAYTFLGATEPELVRAYTEKYRIEDAQSASV